MFAGQARTGAIQKDGWRGVSRANLAAMPGGVKWEERRDRSGQAGGEVASYGFISLKSDTRCRPSVMNAVTRTEYRPGESEETSH